MVFFVATPPKLNSYICILKKNCELIAVVYLFIYFEFVAQCLILSTDLVYRVIVK